MKNPKGSEKNTSKCTICPIKISDLYETLKAGQKISNKTKEPTSQHK